MYDEIPRTNSVKSTAIASARASFPDLLRKVADMLEEEPDKYPYPYQIELTETSRGRILTLAHE